MELKTIEQWEKIFDTKVLDGDGFNYGTNRNETLLTELDFLKGCRNSTIIFSKKVLNGINDLKN